MQPMVGRGEILACVVCLSKTPAPVNGIQILAVMVVRNGNEMAMTRGPGRQYCDQMPQEKESITFVSTRRKDVQDIQQ